MNKNISSHISSQAQISKKIVLLKFTTLVIWTQGFFFYADETTFILQHWTEWNSANNKTLLKKHKKGRNLRELQRKDPSSMTGAIESKTLNLVFVKTHSCFGKFHLMRIFWESEKNTVRNVVTCACTRVTDVYSCLQLAFVLPQVRKHFVTGRINLCFHRVQRPQRWADRKF